MAYAHNLLTSHGHTVGKGRGMLASDRDAVAQARSRWLAANDYASGLRAKLFQTGSGYGDPFARSNDEMRLNSATQEAERLFREYNDIDRKYIEVQMLEIQRSQRQATWAQFVVAAVVGVATIITSVLTLLK